MSTENRSSEIKIKYTKKDLIKPDQVLQGLSAGFEWSRKHSQIFFGLIAAVVVVGVVVTSVQYYTNSKEEKLQAKYFAVEKRYLDKKRDFEEASKNSKSTKAKATGDLQKDYGTEVADLEALVKEAGPSKAGAMASLNLSELYLGYNQVDQAKAALDLVGAKGSGLLAGLVQLQMGNVAEAKGDCKTAVGIWTPLANDKDLDFLSGEIKMRMALCYEAMNDLSKAESLFTEASKKVDSSAGEMGGGTKDSDRYLRMLKLKKQQGS